MKKWEYQIVYSKAERKGRGLNGWSPYKPSPTLENEINKLGEEGWEMVSFTPSSVITASLLPATQEVESYICVFKREIT